MNKIELCFIKSHIRRAIYELEVANKLKPNTIDSCLINELKNMLEKLSEK